METEEIKITTRAEEKQLTEREQQQLDNTVQQAKREFMSYPFEFPAGVMDKVPKSKHSQALDAFKQDVINFEAEKAREILITLNSSKRKAKEDELWLNHRNWTRLQSWNSVRLEQINAGQTLKDDRGDLVSKNDVLFQIDQLRIKLEQSREQLKIFGMNEANVIKEL